MLLTKLLQKLELETTEQRQRSTRWINKDIAPLTVSRRTWTTWTFLFFWNSGNFTASSYSGGSSLVSLGLSIPATVGILMIGKVLTTLAAIFNAWPGAKFHIGYTIAQRQVFGIYGSALGISLRIILGIVWYGSNAWMGGLCLGCLLSSIFPTYQNMKNTFPEDVYMTRKDLVSFFLYQIICMIGLRFPPENVTIPVAIGTVYNMFNLVGILAWARTHAGTIGPLVHATTTVHGSSLAWVWLYGITSTFGGIITGIANQSDFTRYSRKKTDPILGTILGLWFFSTLVPTLGILITSCLQSIYNEQYWNPIYVVQLWLDNDYSSTSRAAAFFASLGYFYAQFLNSVIENGVPAGMDLAGVFPKYINIFRGAIIVSLLSWVIQPWRFYNTSSTFVSVMGAFSVFMTPLVSIMITDFWLVRGRNINLMDLYHSEKTGSYYYTWGINFRALIAWFITISFNLPGMMHNINTDIKVSTGISHYFEANLFFGFPIAMVLYFGFCKIWPIENCGELDDVDFFGTWTIEEANKVGIVPFNEMDKETKLKYNLLTHYYDMDEEGHYEVEAGTSRNSEEGKQQFVVDVVELK